MWAPCYRFTHIGGVYLYHNKILEGWKMTQYAVHFPRNMEYGYHYYVPCLF